MAKQLSMSILRISCIRKNHILVGNQRIKILVSKMCPRVPLPHPPGRCPLRAMQGEISEGNSNKLREASCGWDHHDGHCTIHESETLQALHGTARSGRNAARRMDSAPASLLAVVGDSRSPRGSSHTAGRAMDPKLSAPLLRADNAKQALYLVAGNMHIQKRHSNNSKGTKQFQSP